MGMQAWTDGRHDRLMRLRAKHGSGNILPPSHFINYVALFRGVEEGMQMVAVVGEKEEVVGV